MINRRLGPFRVDLFASRLFNQLPQHASWRPHPEEIACDAFSLDWAQMRGYANLPWNLIHMYIGRVLSQMRAERARLIRVTLFWKAQLWYPALLNMAIQPPILLPKGKDLYQPTHWSNTPDIYPRQVAWNISGRDTEVKDFQVRLRNSYWPRGDKSHQNLMTHCSQSGELV